MGLWLSNKQGLVVVNVFSAPNRDIEQDAISQPNNKWLVLPDFVSLRNRELGQLSVVNETLGGMENHSLDEEITDVDQLFDVLLAHNQQHFGQAKELLWLSLPTQRRFLLLTTAILAATFLTVIYPPLTISLQKSKLFYRTWNAP